MELVPSTPDAQGSPEDWEDRAFAQARYFTVHRFSSDERREIMDELSFPEALARIGDATKEGYRTLLYVVTHAGRVVCLPAKRYPEFIKQWASRHCRVRGNAR